jgi:hypothetical protein
MMCTAVDAIDDEVTAIAEFVGKFLGQDATDHGFRFSTQIIEDQFAPLVAKCSLHRADDVAALAHGA